MKKDNEPVCDEKDYLHHYLIEQINRISVEEQEEQMKEELQNNDIT
ncbi:hypothetical protein ACQUWN_22605 [Rossellomorea aquimaris]|nr:hypothetical protein [Rossellomorea vietnamensis]